MKLIAKIGNTASSLAMSAKTKIASFFGSKEEKCVLSDDRGETYIGEAVKILIAVVIGALVLALVYALIKDTVFEQVKTKIAEMFSYSGS